MSNVIDVFKSVLAESNVSELEMSWNLKMSLERFKAILTGEKKCTDQEEQVMIRFIVKQNQDIMIYLTPNGNNSA